MSYEARPQNQFPIPGYFKFIIYGIGLILLFSIFSRSIFLTIEPGKAGVLFKRFAGGIDKEKIYDPGFHIIAPWNKMFIYETRVNEGVEKMEVLSRNGLTIVVELSYRYYPKNKEIGLLHENIGPEYARRIMIPEIRSATREVIGKYLPEELYSTKREVIQEEMYVRTSAAIDKKHIILDAILIREVMLPQKLKEAIELKLGEEQMAFQYEFKLDRERKEAERKIIEAQAKADANKILNASLTDKILKDKGIEATIQLANSPNTKVIVIGDSGSGGLPLILGGN
jgi:prohibitin 1